jgi:NADPH2:quinone reductase
MTRRIVIDAYGGPEALRLDRQDPGPPGPGQARVAQTAIGVNFIDTYHRTGLYPLPSLPHGIGMEAAGAVEAVGEGVTGLTPGDRVAYAGGPPEAYASTRIIDAEQLIPLPDDIEEDVAAAAMLKGMTVEYLIRRCRPVARGETVLLHAAAGGVGLLACQWLAHLGATVLGTVGSDAKAELARAHGCHHPIVYTKERFRERVLELTGGGGVPVVFDSVGRATFHDSLDCLAPRGMMVSFGNASGKPELLDPVTLAQKGSLFLTRPSLAGYTRTREERVASAQALFEVLREGAVQVEIRQRFRLEDAAEAHRALEARETTGSTILQA